jgi:hypothetical protein
VADQVEILGEIQSIETIASGASVRIGRLLTKATVLGSGGSARGSPWFVSLMDSWCGQRYTGMRRTAAVEST